MISHKILCALLLTGSLLASCGSTTEETHATSARPAAFGGLRGEARLLSPSEIEAGGYNARLESALGRLRSTQLEQKNHERASSLLSAWDVIGKVTDILMALDTPGASDVSPVPLARAVPRGAADFDELEGVFELAREERGAQRPAQ